MDRLLRERRQKPIERTSFNLSENIYFLTWSTTYFTVMFFSLVSLFVTLENAAKFTKLSAKTYGEPVSAQLVYINDSLMTLCFALD